MTGIVLAHNGAAEAVERHMLSWRETFEQTIIISPYDDYLPGSLPLGTSVKNGIGQIERMLFACVMASRFERAAVLEYDTVFFGANLAGMEIPENALICSEVFAQANDSDKGVFTAETYGHSPWIATGETWWKFATNAGDSQHGVPDRWLALAAQRARVSIYGMEQGFSCDTEWTPEVRWEACRARVMGSCIFHGVKTQDAWRALVTGRID